MPALIPILIRWVAIPLLSGATLWGIGAAVKGVSYLAFFTGAIIFLSQLAALFGKLLNSLATLPNFVLDLQIVTGIWEIVRNFVNLFFILILIVIAFATIFNRPEGYRAKELLPKLIIAALLVNFSLVITQTVIELLYVPAPIFLKALGGPDFSGKIANALRIQNIFSFRDMASAFTANQLQGYFTTSGLIYLISIVVTNVVIVWVGLVLLIRMVMLIALATVSPVTWLAYSFPRMQHFWDDWWCKVLYWSLIPAFIFGVIYFSLLINQSLANIQIPPIPLMFGITLDKFLIIGITATLLIGGLWWVNNFLSKTACLAGYGLVGATFGKVRGWFWGGAGYVAGKAAGGAQTIYRKTGIPSGAEGLRERMIAEGRLFGTDAMRTREARVEERLAGIAGLRPTYPTQRITEEQSEKAKRDIENELKQAKSTTEENVIIERLKKAAEEGAKKGTKSPETLAAIKVLAKRGQLDVDLFNKAVENFKNMPLALTSVINEWKEGKFGGITIQEFLDTMRDKDNKLNLDSRRTMYNFVASDDGKKIAEKMDTYKDEKGNDITDYKTGYEILSMKDKRDFSKKVGGARPDLKADYTFNVIRKDEKHPEYDGWTKMADKFKEITGRGVEDIKDVIFMGIKDASAKDLSGINTEVWKKEEFKQAFRMAFKERERISPEAAARLKLRLERILIDEGSADQLRVLHETTTETTAAFRVASKIITPPGEKISEE